MKTLFRTLLVAASVTLAWGCGGDKKDPQTQAEKAMATPAQFEADPYLLFPGNAISLSSTDAQAFFRNSTLGLEMAKVVSSLVPLGEESGFSAPRDVDRVIVASYTLSGANIVGTLLGRFDEGRISAAARAKQSTPMGPIFESTYAGKHLFTVSNLGFTIVSPKLALVGDEQGMRRALDRWNAGISSRAMEPWMIETAMMAGVDSAVAIDLSKNPVEKLGIPGANIDVVRGLRIVRAYTKSSGGKQQVAATATYGQAADATRSDAALKQAVRLLNAIAIGGLTPSIDRLESKIVDANVQLTFEVQEAKLVPLLREVPGWLQSRR